MGYKKCKEKRKSQAAAKEPPWIVIKGAFESNIDGSHDCFSSNLCAEPAKIPGPDSEGLFTKTKFCGVMVQTRYCCARKAKLLGQPEHCSNTVEKKARNQSVWMRLRLYWQGGGTGITFAEIAARFFEIITLNPC